MPSATPFAAPARSWRRGAALWAVCVYHKQGDLWQLPLLLQCGLPADDYRFFLRKHGGEIFDTVCYAVPANRLLRPASCSSMTSGDTDDRQRSIAWCIPVEPRDCPICDGTNRRLLYRQRFSEMSAGSLLAGYDVVVCEACGLAYADNIPSQPAFDAHYRDMSKYERQDCGCRESEFDIRRFRAIAEIIARVQPDRAARILDVGCAIGGMLAAMKDLGYSNLLGVDPSPSCAAAAAEVHGIEVVTGTLANLPSAIANSI